MATAIMKQKEVPEMDDVEEIISKISEESPYKRRPTQKRTWMTVPEMGKLLGLKKTDRYWLVHKNVFESKESAGKIRINIASFEKWYANQIKYHKVTGEEPGKELKSWSYSVKEVADLLGVDEYLVYDLLKKNQMEAVIVDYWKRIPKESLRLGELLGLTWDCVDISPEAIEENRAYVFINKESQRIRKESLNALDGKDVLLVFPTNHKKNSTVRILKTPKTESSVRKIFLPKSVANMLVDWKAEQDEMKEILGDEYMDYNLVMASTFGLPLGDGAIRGPLKKLIEDYNLPPVVFHSFRHSSVTYKLKLNGGDIKAVQGDSGHAQVNMVTDVYSHILDDDRRKNAELFEEAFYEKKNLDPQMHVQQGNNNATVADEVDPELLAKVLANPEMRALLNSLVKTMK